MRFGWVVALLASGAPLLTASAAEAGPSAAQCLSERERTEIVDLMARYAIYADAAEGEAFASTFTPDGALIIRGEPVRGRANLAKMIGGKVDRTLHLPSAPVLVKVAPDRVRARSQLLYMRQGHSDGATAPQMAPAVYEDTIVHTREGWKFLERQATDMPRVSPEFLPSYPPRACPAR